MLQNLYGNGGLIFQTITTGLTEAHVPESKVRVQVLKTDEVDAKFKNRVKEQYNAKYLDDSDAVIRFFISNQQAPAPDQGGQNSEEQAQQGGQDSGNLNEAEMTATGGALKDKIIETVQRCLFIEDKQSIELNDLSGYFSNGDACFIKMSFENKNQTAQA
jgi:hypothetical protein